ncbi:aquaporin-10-like isoform X2 [Amphiura filiformis]
MTEPWFERLERRLQPLRIKSKLGRACLAEFIGIFILVIFHHGAIAQVILSRGGSGTFLSINWGGGVGLFLGVYYSAGISGGHLNPAVSLGFTLLGKLRWAWLPCYMMAQFFGAFCASIVLYGVYIDGINNIDGGTRQVTGPNATAGIFGTYPQEFLSLGEGVFDQIVGTALLMGTIAAVTDERNHKPVKGMEPYIIGMILFGVGLAFGFNCGYSLNPAKDLGPRLFAYIAQYGPKVWAPYGKQWWWVPIVGPLIGGPVGAWTYYLIIGLHHPPVYKAEGEEINNGTTAGNGDAEGK